VDFRLHFIGLEQDGELSSMHGAAEIDEDLRELCAMHRYPGHRRWMDYVRCRDRDIRSTDWQKCAVDGIDAKVIESCVAGEGRKLLEEDFRLAQGLGISASPTFIANGRSSFHGIDAEAIRAGYCAQNASAAACSKKADARGDAAPAPAGCDK
jgi:hypothetical protein